MTKRIAIVCVAGFLLGSALWRPALAQAPVVMPPAAPAVAPAQAPSAGALPSGGDVLARYVDATGGTAAYDAVRNRVVRARMEIQGAGIVFHVTVYAARPASVLTLIDSDATGHMESGVWNGVVWENSALRGPIVKDGAERDDTLRDAAFDHMARWKEHFTSVECTGVADVNGNPAYRVVVTPKIGSRQTLYFDRETALLVRSESMIDSAAGQIAVTAEPDDYRKVGGILTPFTSRVSLLGQQRTLTVETIEQNVDLAADRFDPPAEIKALLRK
ncbi:MAG TPA: hypothetical protein PLE61_04205 [Vicinamibacterales bacterium]|nr:hypothetical protein [Vicinamibacterales bacterium]